MKAKESGMKPSILSKTAMQAHLYFNEAFSGLKSD